METKSGGARTSRKHEAKGSGAALALTPGGKLRLEHPAGDGCWVDPSTLKRIVGAFERGPGHGVFQLGAAEVAAALPPTLAFWRDFGRLFVTKLCGLADLEEKRETFTVPVPREELSRLAATAPPMRGGEYLSVDVLERLWGDLEDACRTELRESASTFEDFLHAKDPVWNLVGRVHFHLAEQKGSVWQSETMYHQMDRVGCLHPK